MTKVYQLVSAAERKCVAGQRGPHTAVRFCTHVLNGPPVPHLHAPCDLNRSQGNSDESTCQRGLRRSVESPAVQQASGWQPHVPTLHSALAPNLTPNNLLCRVTTAAAQPGARRVQQRQEGSSYLARLATWTSLSAPKPQAVVPGPDPATSRSLRPQVPRLSLSSVTAASGHQASPGSRPVCLPTQTA